MSHSTKHFHAGKAAAAFVAAQRTSDLTRRTAGGREAGSCPHGVDNSDVYPKPTSDASQDTDTYEAARRQRAARDVLADCELGRLCKLRMETREYVLWNYGHKFADGEGRITRQALFIQCLALGIVKSRRTFNAWLQSGMGVYWRERGGYLYLTSWKKLARRIVSHAAKYHPDWVSTNLPGQARVSLDLTGTLQSVHANLYAGWFTVKCARRGYLDISRYTLGILWGTSRKTQLTYEKLMGIRVEERYAEHHNIHNPLVPNHATLHLDLDGREFVSWQISNRFFPPQIEIHPHNGQRAKVRAVAKLAVETSDPVVIKPDGGRRFQRIGRITFTNKRGKRGLITAYKQISRHVRKHQDAGLRPHYAYLTSRYGNHIYEMTTGDCLRSAAMDIDRQAEQDAAFILRRMQYRIGWASRVGVEGF